MSVTYLMITSCSAEVVHRARNSNDVIVLQAVSAIAVFHVFLLKLINRLICFTVTMAKRKAANVL